MVKLSTEFLDNSEVIGDYQYADLERVFEMLVWAGFTNVKDCGFLCVDFDGVDHCRMLVGDNPAGRKVVATICDNPHCTGQA